MELLLYVFLMTKLLSISNKRYFYKVAFFISYNTSPQTPFYIQKNIVDKYSMLAILNLQTASALPVKGNNKTHTSNRVSFCLSIVKSFSFISPDLYSRRLESTSLIWERIAVLTIFVV